MMIPAALAFVAIPCCVAMPPENGSGENGSGWLLRALEHRRANIAYWESRRGERDGGITPERWEFLGPTNIGGRTRSLVIHPTQPHRMWAGAVGGGVWHSADGGESWAPVDGMESLPISCMAADPQDPSVMYAGTGEGWLSDHPISGLGVLRSTDEGLTWPVMPSTAGWEGVGRIAVRAADPAELFVGRHPFGLMRSLDGGSGWTNLAAPLTQTACLSVALDPNGVSHWVAAFFGLVTGVGQSFFKSQAALPGPDGWATASNLREFGELARVEVAFAPATAGMVYALTGEDGGRVYRSVNGGLFYSRRSPGTPLAGVTRTTAALWVDPSNSDFVLVGGGDVYRSTDGGVTLTRISAGGIGTEDPGIGVHAFVPDPGFNGATNRRMYVCTEAGIFRTENIDTAAPGSGWEKLTDGYVTAHFLSARAEPGAGIVLAGAAGLGAIRLPLDPEGHAEAAAVHGGLVLQVAIDHEMPQFLYGTGPRLSIFRSRDGGQTTEPMDPGIWDIDHPNTQWAAPIALDPNEPRRMLVGSGTNIWRCLDTRADTPVWTSFASNYGYVVNVTAIDIARGDSNTVWVGNQFGKLFRSESAMLDSPFYGRIDNMYPGVSLPVTRVTKVLIDPDDKHVVYAAFDRYANNPDMFPSTLYRTADSGATWTEIRGSGPTALPNVTIHAMARHPTDPDRLYVGTDVGVFVTSDGGATWSTSDQGPAGAAVHDLSFIRGTTTLLAATYGRGLWTIDVLTCGADWNNQGGVNSSDISAFLAAWLASLNQGTLDADFNGDSLVNSSDISAFLAAWLEQIAIGC